MMEKSERILKKIYLECQANPTPKELTTALRMFFLTLPLNTSYQEGIKSLHLENLCCALLENLQSFDFFVLAPLFLSLEKMTRTKYQKESPHRASSPPETVTYGLIPGYVAISGAT